MSRARAVAFLGTEKISELLIEDLKISARKFNEKNEIKVGKI